MGCPVIIQIGKSLKTLLIGGAGFIGTHLVPLLLATGRNVTVLGRRPAGEVHLPEGAQYVMGDCGRDEMLRSLLDKHQEVIHLAYASVPNTSYDDPLADLQQNLPSLILLFSEMADRGNKLLLISSGGTVYGEAISLPICEDHTTHPISPYGVTKLTLENYAHLYAVTHGLKYVCVRPANAYGVGQRSFAGQGFIAAAMAAALRKQPVKIFGQAGTVRDYLYVEDMARGILYALLYGRESETYNLGSGMGLTNLDVVKAMRPLMQEIGVHIAISHLPERAFDVKVNVLDASKLRVETGWTPKVPFVDGLERTRDWLLGMFNE